MNIKVEFLLEEKSMEEALRNILPKILPTNYILDKNVFLRPHQGKSDLQKSIPRKITAAINNKVEKVMLIILHDQDNHNCIKLKQDLQELCKTDSFLNSVPCLIRIVCQELESWYLGDLEAVESAYPTKFKASKYKNKQDFRNPDKLVKPSERLKKILPEFQKVQTAKSVSKFMSIEKNNSKSFEVFISGVKRFLENNLSKGINIYG